MPEHKVAQPLLTTEQAARIVGRAVATLESMRVRGGGPKFRKIGRSVYYAEPELLEWLEANSRLCETTSDYAGEAA